MAKHKFAQKVPMTDFKVINDLIKHGTLYAMRDPKPNGLKMDHIAGRVTQAFNLGQKIELETDAVVHKDDALKLSKFGDEWFLVITSAKR